MLSPARLPAVAVAVLTAALATALLAGAATAQSVDAEPSASSAASSQLLTPRGIGRVKIGMTIPQARRASGHRIKAYGELNAGCGGARIPSLRVNLLVLNGRIAQFSTRSERIHTIGYISIGADGAAVHDEFENVKTTERPYQPDADSLYVQWAKGKYAGKGYRFDTDDEGTIDTIYAGTSGPLHLMEGCA